MTLVEAAAVIERLQARSATVDELIALRVARDALLTIVSEGFTTIDDRIRAVRSGFVLQTAGGTPSICCRSGDCATTAS